MHTGCSRPTRTTSVIGTEPGEPPSHPVEHHRFISRSVATHPSRTLEYRGRHSVSARSFRLETRSERPSMEPGAPNSGVAQSGGNLGGFRPSSEARLQAYSSFRTGSSSATLYAPGG